jgi:hypothetical protein
MALPTKYGDKDVCSFFLAACIALEVNRDGDECWRPFSSKGSTVTSSCLTSIRGWFLLNDRIASLVKSQQPLRSISFRLSGALTLSREQFVNTASQILSSVNLGTDDRW